MTDSTAKRSRVKPAKPHSGWPLFAHNNGSWAKKIKGKLHYFGPWADPDGALQRYQDFLAGRPQGARSGELSVADGVNEFLSWKEGLLNSAELSLRTFRDYVASGRRLVEFFGRDRPVSSLTPRDFEDLRAAFSKRLGHLALKREITATRTIFRYLDEVDLIDRPVKFGPGFKPPAQRAVQRAQNGAGRVLKMFEREELLALLAAADPHFRAMVFMGANCAYGNTDISRLPVAAIEGEWATFPRPKTGADRRAWLWPETREALQVHLDNKPKPVNSTCADLVFLTHRGEPWVRKTETEWTDWIADYTWRTLNRIGLYRPGLSFYSLRRTFRTIADESRDEPAIDLVMGHSRSDMGSVYRQRIGDDRIQAVCERVRSWLFGGENKR